MTRNRCVWTSLLIGIFIVVLPGQALPDLKRIEQRPMAPDFTLRDIDGTPYRLHKLRGKVVLVNFWATWCPPCRAEMPSLQRLWERLADEDFVLLAVAVNEKPPAIRKFLRSMKPSLRFTVLLDSEMDVARYWPLKGLPATFIMDKHSRVAYITHGALNWDTTEVITQLRQLIAEPLTPPIGTPAPSDKPPRG